MKMKKLMALAVGVLAATAAMFAAATAPPTDAGFKIYQVEQEVLAPPGTTAVSIAAVGDRASPPNAASALMGQNDGATRSVGDNDDYFINSRTAFGKAGGFRGSGHEGCKPFVSSSRGVYGAYDDRLLAYAPIKRG